MRIGDGPTNWERKCLIMLKMNLKLIASKKVSRTFHQDKFCEKNADCDRSLLTFSEDEVLVLEYHLNAELFCRFRSKQQPNSRQ